ncbi:MAG TPA: GatB/YqeY domain-containing protein [Candidatus Krumholzibacteriaceae bacterium]|nr:GatB/YqeY domain-containing protein [Candidatus Krumholzibacteriaceae bacterium]
MGGNKLAARIQDDLKDAIKGREKVKLKVLRMLLSTLKNAQIEQGGELDEEKEIQVISSYARKCRESIAEFQKGAREDLVSNERADLEIVTTYLPKQLDKDEIRIELKKIIEKTGASTPRDMGRVMGPIMSKFKGRVDGSMVKQMAIDILKAGE